MEDVVWGFTVPDTSDEAYLHPQITLSLSPFFSHRWTDTELATD